MSRVDEHISRFLILLVSLCFFSCSEYETSYFEELNLELSIEKHRYYELTLRTPGKDLVDTISFELYPDCSRPLLYIVPPNYLFLNNQVCNLVSARMYNYKLRLVNSRPNIQELLNPELLAERDSSFVDSLQVDFPLAFRATSNPHNLKIRMPNYTVSYYGEFRLNSSDGHELQKDIKRKSFL